MGGLLNVFLPVQAQTGFFFHCPGGGGLHYRFDPFPDQVVPLPLQPWGSPICCEPLLQNLLDSSAKCRVVGLGALPQHSIPPLFRLGVK